MLMSIRSNSAVKRGVSPFSMSTRKYPWQQFEKKIERAAYISSFSAISTSYLVESPRKGIKHGVIMHIPNVATATFGIAVVRHNCTHLPRKRRIVFPDTRSSRIIVALPSDIHYNTVTMIFDEKELLKKIAEAEPDVLDELKFGIIGIDREMNITAYNEIESEFSGLSREFVLGKHLFQQVAPCMNNYLVSLRFEREDAIDEIIPYVLSFKVTPTPVELRLMKSPDIPTMCLAILWK